METGKGKVESLTWKSDESGNNDNVSEDNEDADRENDNGLNEGL